MFHRLEKLLVQIRAPAANYLRNPRITCNANLVQQYRWENLNLNKKVNLGFKNWLPIRDPYILSRHHTFPHLLGVELEFV
jgi:hypothetical protein